MVEDRNYMMNFNVVIFTRGRCREQKTIGYNMIVKNDICSSSFYPSKNIRYNVAHKIQKTQKKRKLQKASNIKAMLYVTLHL